MYRISWKSGCLVVDTRWQTDERGLHIRRSFPYFVKNAYKWREEQSAGKKLGPNSSGWCQGTAPFVNKVNSKSRALTAGLHVAAKLMSVSLSLCCSNDTAVRHLAVPLLPTAGHHIPRHRTGRRPIFGQRGKCDQNIDGILHSSTTHHSPIWRVNAIFTHCWTTSLAKVPTDNP